MNVKQFFLDHQHDNNEEWFTALQKNNIEDYNDYLIFNLNHQLDAPFLFSCQFLSSRTTLNEAQALHYINDGCLIAQTIDGHYLLAIKDTTIIIPVDLHVTDIEFFSLPIAQFMVLLINKKIQSNYINIQ